VITRISAKDIAALVPFKVVVPMQPIPPWKIDGKVS
jgi:hypothetical protein